MRFQVYPLSGPLEGGTLLTITGTNLGRSIDHIHHSIFIADVPCEVIPSEYVVSRRSVDVFMSLVVNDVHIRY